MKTQPFYYSFVFDQEILVRRFILRKADSNLKIKLTINNKNKTYCMTNAYVQLAS